MQKTGNEGPFSTFVGSRLEFAEQNRQTTALLVLGNPEKPQVTREPGRRFLPEHEVWAEVAPYSLLQLRVLPRVEGTTVIDVDGETGFF